MYNLHWQLQFQRHFAAPTLFAMSSAASTRQPTARWPCETSSHSRPRHSHPAEPQRRWPCSRGPRMWRVGRRARLSLEAWARDRTRRRIFGPRRHRRLTWIWKLIKFWIISNGHCWLSTKAGYTSVFLCFVFSIRPPSGLLPVLGLLEAVHDSFTWRSPAYDISLSERLTRHTRRDLIHQRRVKCVIRPPLYPQATAAGYTQVLNDTHFRVDFCREFCAFKNLLGLNGNNALLCAQFSAVVTGLSKESVTKIMLQ